MLQFIAKKSDRYSVAELCQMAIEGGCMWIRFAPGDMSEEEIREIAAELVPLCKETSTILTIEGHPEIARQLGLHGVYLSGVFTREQCQAIREDLGPEAIIGVEARTADHIISLGGIDMDFCQLPEDTPTDVACAIVQAVRSASVEIPIVAAGEYTPDAAAVVMATGVNGIAVSAVIAEASDPVGMTENIISALR